MDGGRRRRQRPAEDRTNDAARAAWYAWWRSARFAAHFGQWDRPHPHHFNTPPMNGGGHRRGHGLGAMQQGAMSSN
jgi:hypothetical protein